MKEREGGGGVSGWEKKREGDCEEEGERMRGHKKKRGYERYMVRNKNGVRQGKR